jgi:hypothetical protein
VRRHRAAAGALGGAVGHFPEVSRGYWPGPFACYGAADLPRTDGDLGRLSGSRRCHERRATGRKGASPALALRGSARLVAGLATRQREVTAADLAGADRGRRKKLRAEPGRRRRRRVDRHRFRRDPDGYLRGLEAKLDQPALPP